MSRTVDAEADVKTAAKDLSPVHHVVLRFLMGAPAHGYALHKRIATLGRFYPLRNVNIYSVLRDLEREGFAVSRTEIQSHRARKVYEITERGTGTLRAWIGAPPDEDGFLFQQDVIGLKLLLATQGCQADLGWLTETLEDLEAEIARSRSALERHHGVLTPVGERTLRWRIDMVEQRRAYLADVVRLLEERAGANAAG